MPSTALTWIIAAILLAASLYSMLPARTAHPGEHGAHAPQRCGILLGLGAVVGFGAGRSGAGGPLFSVPLMLALRFDPLATTGTGQAVQVPAPLSGSIGNMTFGTINYRLAIPVTLAELVGVLLGVRIPHVARGHQLRHGAAALCLICSIGMAAKTWH